MKAPKLYIWFIIALFGISYSLDPAHIKSHSNKKDFFALVIDAGSKGSRILVFKFETKALNQSALAIPQTIGTKVVRPGLSSFALNPEDLKPTLSTLIDYARATLSGREQYFRYYPIYLKGTAGLRDLIPIRRDEVMWNVKQVLADSPFSFHDRQATVISGESEGSFAWLTVNIMRNSLSEYGENDSVGILDLGGASLQVAFVPPKGHYVLEHYFPMDIDPNNPISLYAKSYLHYGLVEAARRLDSLVITNALLTVESLAEIDNPCYYSDMEYRPDFSSMRIPVNATMIGTGDFEECRMLVKQLMNKQQPCWVKDCSFDGVYQPRLKGRRFVAISAFAKIVKMCGLGENATLADLRARATEACSTSFDDIERVFPDAKKEMRVYLCFTAVYAYTLLTYGLGFPKDLEAGVIQFVRPKKREAYNVVDWAFGAVIWEVNNLAPSVIEEFLRDDSGDEEDDE